MGRSNLTALALGDCGMVSFVPPGSPLEVQRELGITATGDWGPFPEILALHEWLDSDAFPGEAIAGRRQARMLRTGIREESVMGSALRNLKG